MRGGVFGPRLLARVPARVMVTMDHAMTSRPVAPSEVRSRRLLLRRWRDDDVPRFAAINADRVARIFLALNSWDHV